MNKNKSKIVVLGLLLCLSITGCGTGTTTNENTFVMTTEADSILVSGSSVKKVAPDVAKVTFSVRTEDTTAEASQSKNTEDINAVVSVLKGMGVPDNKIKTYNYQMYPDYEYIYNNVKMTDERVLKGYVVTNTLEVSGLEVEKVGEVLTTCVQAGINDIDGIDYTCSNYDELYNEALSNAVEVARKKAEAIAGTSNVKVGSVKRVNEGWQDTSYRYTNNMAMKNSATFDETVGGAYSYASAMAGEIEIKANVEVTFEIVQ